MKIWQSTTKMIMIDIKKYLPDIFNGGLNILDIGTGNGIFVEVCNKYKNNCIGIENIDKTKSNGYSKRYSEYYLDIVEEHKEKNLNIFYIDAIDLFTNGNSDIDKIKYNIINLRYSFSLIFSKYRKTVKGIMRWDYNKELYKSIGVMLDYFKKIICNSGIVFIQSHYSSNPKKYSVEIIKQFEYNGFKLIRRYDNINHKFGYTYV